MTLSNDTEQRRRGIDILSGSPSTDRASGEIATLVDTVQKHSNDVILVLVAFDGVLAEYTKDPDTVTLPPHRRKLLRLLIGNPGVALGVVSGRRVDDLRQRIGLGDEVFYIGLHGLEIVGPGFAHVAHQTLANYREPVREISAAAAPLIAQIDGAHLENKEAVLALHTRQANASDAIWARLRLLSQAGQIADMDDFRVLRGNHVLELFPNTGHAKAAAIDAVRDVLERRQGRNVFAVYVGEDVPDDDGSEAIADRGVVAAVGRRAARAQYHLNSTEEVDRLLGQLAALRDSGAAQQPS